MDMYFWEGIVCLVYKLLLPFLNFVNYKGPYLAEGFLHNLCPCFDIEFARLGIIPTTRNKFVEIVAIAECYLVTNHVKNTALPVRARWLENLFHENKLNMKL